MATPCIKGTAFDSVLQDVRQLIESGRIPRDEIEAALEADELRYLEEKIGASRWYPIECYARLLGLLCRIEGGDDPEGYLFRRGMIAGERLHAAGIYPQLDATAGSLGLRILPLVISIAGAIYNFTRWRFEIDEAGEGFRVLVDDAEDYPDVARRAAEGFLHCTARRVTAREVQVRSERPSPDRVVFHAEMRGKVAEG